jgi:hypothetical protein
MERSKALWQALALAWPWFAGALACLALSALLSWTTSVPAKVINVLPCAYVVNKGPGVPGSRALVETADGRDHYTWCEEGQPFTIGRETQLDQSIFGGDPINIFFPMGALLLAGVLFFFGGSLVSQRLKWGKRWQEQNVRHKGRHSRHGRHEA